MCKLGPLVVGWLGLGSLLGSVAAEALERPDVLLVTVDTLRPDALGWIGGHDETPQLDALALGGVRFSGAIAPAPVTQPSHASILTGLLPGRHGLRDNGRVLPESLPTLAAELSKAGWTSAAFVSGHPLSAVFGFGAAFDHFDDDFGDGRLERSADRTTDAVLAWRRGGRAPAFVWVHYFDPHDPYEPPPPFRDGDPYRGEVSFVDREIGRLLEGWPEGLAPLVVFAGDHGESMGQHGETTHGFFAYDATVAVPLVFFWPGHLAPRAVEAPARLLDITPTVLGLLELSPLEAIDGVDLRPWLLGKEGVGEVPPAVIESWRPWFSYGWAPLRAVRTARWKLVAAPRPELYDLAADPGETRNVVHEHRGEARRLERILQDLAQGSEAEAGGVGPEDLVKLEALGYVGAGRRAVELPPLASLADPKDRISAWEDLSSAVAALEEGRSNEALALFDRVAAEDPRNPFAWLRGGLAARRLGDLEGASRRLLRGLALRAEDVEGWGLLGRVHLEAGQNAAAGAAFARACELRPGDASSWEGRAVAAGRLGRSAEALTFLEEAARREPKTRRWMQVALLRLGAGDEDAARQALRAAVDLDPRLAEQLAEDPKLGPLMRGETLPRP